MRRKDRDVTSPETIDAILTDAPVCHLGMCLENIPYVVPLNFVHVDNRLYVHSALKGKKLDILRDNPNVCVQVDLHGGFIPDPDDACESGYRYKSLIANGVATFVEESSHKLIVLEALAKKYFRKSVPVNEKTARGTVVLEIVLDEVAVKQAGLWD